MTARRGAKFGSHDVSPAARAAGSFNSTVVYKLLIAVACFWFGSLMLFSVYEMKQHPDGPTQIKVEVQRQAPDRDSNAGGLLDRLFDAHEQVMQPRQGFWQPPEVIAREHAKAEAQNPEGGVNRNQDVVRPAEVVQPQENKVDEKPLVQDPAAASDKILVFESTADPNAVGEFGRAATVKVEELAPSEKAKYDTGLQQNAFNQYISDKISIRRRLPDIRDAECKTEQYPTSLPSVSVVLCFHNEAWSVLRRSVWSIIDRSDLKLIREIVLVDDASTNKELGESLDAYVSHFAEGFIKVVRAKKREGLIRARLLGASAARGDVIIFLDSHIECTDGWLEPLLGPIARNWSAVTVPVIDVIDDSTFALSYNNARATQIGGFDWNLQYTWRPVPANVRASLRAIDPLPTPTMAGGLFAISRSYFEYIGSYDPGMEIWGGENLELSFRIWMCGGSLLIIPCSHVGHIFRKRSPYSWAAGGPNPLKKNSVRLAEVWMDDYKKYYYERINNDLGQYGDVSARKALRERLQCKSFEWFVKTIYPDLFIPGESLASGEIRNAAFAQCIDSPADHKTYSKRVNLWPCHNQGGNQYWLMSKNFEIRRDDACIDFPGNEVIMYQCHGMKGNQLWSYLNSNQLLHVVTGKCLGISADGKQLVVEQCDANNQRQLWQWTRKNETTFKSK